MFVHQRIENLAFEHIPRLMLQIHGGAAMLTLVVLGALFGHVQRGWKARQNRLSGSVLLGVNGLLALSGYGLYYASDEGLRDFLSQWHARIGLSVAGLLVLHVVTGRIQIRRLASRKGRR